MCMHTIIILYLYVHARRRSKRSLVRSVGDLRIDVGNVRRSYAPAHKALPARRVDVATVPRVRTRARTTK